MNNEILNSIAKDLKIDALEDGITKDEYRCAVIYSAAALWAKTSSQDILDNVDRGSRKHVIQVCSAFIKKSLKGESEIVQNYFNNSDHDPEKSAAVKLVNALIRVRELSETGNNPLALTLSLPSDRTVQLSPHHQAILGFLGTEGKDCIKDYIMMSGLSFIINEESGEYPKLVNNFQWVENELIRYKFIKPTRTIELNYDLYFDIHDYGDRRFTKHKPHKNYPFEIVMNDTIAGEQYFLKTENGFFRFDEMSIKLKEHHRFMIYLVNKMKGRMIQIRDKSNIFYLDLYLPLPLYEDSLLRQVLWPRRNIDDAGSFFGPQTLKPYISNILISLGFDINETK